MLILNVFENFKELVTLSFCSKYMFSIKKIKDINEYKYTDIFLF